MKLMWNKMDKFYARLNEIKKYSWNLFALVINLMRIFNKNFISFKIFPLKLQNALLITQPQKFMRSKI